ncbi:MAG: right-handed parallel beta-helix repeat-containing protein [Lentisphaeria bacterium]|nr:right-handed parallel beta-helix repeat-containing protein [Candidatus Neomarinimicrobiota bacterium]MCF7841937.1 right-handed parallel beta-helix repeat-containing protein [Lentisphaeria bacterium]
MKHFLQLLSLILFMITSSLSAQTQVSGDVSGTWDARNSPYVLTSDALVPIGDSLIVEPGVIIRSPGEFELRVAGFLRMTAARYTGGAGIFIEDGTVHIRECTIDSVTNGIKVFGGHLEIRDSGLENITENGLAFHNSASGLVQGNGIFYCGRYGIRITTSDEVVVRENYLSGNSTSTTTYPALFIDSCSPDSIYQNLIVDNHAQGIGIWALTGTAAPQLSQNLVRGNFTGITIVNATPVLHENIVVANFVEGNPNSGAGLYIGYPNGNPLCSGNVIAGNYYGVSIINFASANLGNLENAGLNDDGGNFIYANRLNGETWNIWNDTENDIYAQNNFWLDLSPDSIDFTLHDNEEDAIAGMILFQPVNDQLVSRMDLNGDLLVNVVDAVALVELILTESVPSPHLFVQGDVTRDYELNILDVTRLLDHIIQVTD